MAVLEALTAAEKQAEMYAYRVAQEARVAATTVGRVVDRMVDSGWAITRWELPPPTGRPPRRLIELTDKGRQCIAEMLADELGPTSRPPHRRPPGGEAL